MKRFRRRDLFAVLALAAVFAACYWAWACRRRPAAAPPLPPGWGLTELARHLEGLGLRVEFAQGNGDPEGGFYATETGLGREQLLSLRKSRQSAKSWEGSLHAFRLGPGADFELPGDDPAACVVAGKVCLYGDPRLIARVLQALGR